GPRFGRVPRSIAIAVIGIVCLLTPIVGAAITSPPLGDPEALIRARIRQEGARYAPLSSIAPAMTQAVVAAEDERFSRHHGVDLLGVIRAGAYDVSHLSFAQGASTITEQLAKNLYFGGDDHSPWRKLQDAWMALRIETRLSKDQILEAYLNTAYFGA